MLCTQLTLLVLFWILGCLEGLPELGFHFLCVFFLFLRPGLLDSCGLTVAAKSSALPFLFAFLCFFTHVHDTQIYRSGLSLGDVSCCPVANGLNTPPNNCFSFTALGHFCAESLSEIKISGTPLLFLVSLLFIIVIFPTLPRLENARLGSVTAGQGTVRVGYIL